MNRPIKPLKEVVAEAFTLVDREGNKRASLRTVQAGTEVALSLFDRNGNRRCTIRASEQESTLEICSNDNRDSLDRIIIGYRSDTGGKTEFSMYDATGKHTHATFAETDTEPEEPMAEVTEPESPHLTESVSAEDARALTDEILTHPDTSSVRAFMQLTSYLAYENDYLKREAIMREATQQAFLMTSAADKAMESFKAASGGNNER